MPLASVAACVVAADYPLMPLTIPKHLAGLIPRGVGNRVNHRGREYKTLQQWTRKEAYVSAIAQNT